MRSIDRPVQCWHVEVRNLGVGRLDLPYNLWKTRPSNLRTLAVLRLKTTTYVRTSRSLRLWWLDQPRTPARLIRQHDRTVGPVAQWRTRLVDRHHIVTHRQLGEFFFQLNNWFWNSSGMERLYGERLRQPRLPVVSAIKRLIISAPRLPVSRPLSFVSIRASLTTTVSRRVNRTWCGGFRMARRCPVPLAATRDYLHRLTNWPTPWRLYAGQPVEGSS